MIEPAVGLCSVCANVRVVLGNGTSKFYLCELAFVDARFRKYPPLPVLECPGLERARPLQ